MLYETRELEDADIAEQKLADFPSEGTAAKDFKCDKGDSTPEESKLDDASMVLECSTSGGLSESARMRRQKGRTLSSKLTRSSREVCEDCAHQMRASVLVLGARL